MQLFFDYLLIGSLLLLLLLPRAHGVNRLAEFCDKGQNSTNTPNSNVADVLKQLVAKAPTTSFATSTSGTGSQKIYGLAQCRGDVNATDCKACLADAAKQLPEICADGSDARIWFDYCFLRYGAQDFIGKLDTGFAIFLYNVNNASDPQKFNQNIGTLINRVKKLALVPKNRGLGKAKAKLTPFESLYGLAQCNADLSQLLCAQCLSIAIAQYPNVCPNSVGCQVLYSSCKVRYETYPFFFPVETDTKNRVAAPHVKSVVYP